MKVKQSDILEERLRELWDGYYTFMASVKHSRRLSERDALPRNADGSLNRRFKSVRTWLANEARAVKLLEPIYQLEAERKAALKYEYENWGEISQRKYPKALRPQIIFDEYGRSMTWDKWLASTTAFSPISRMIFEDGVEVQECGVR